MSEVYIPGSEVLEVNAALWRLVRPPHVRAENEGTELLFGQIQDLTGQSWLVALDDYEIEVHAEADASGITDILRGILPDDILAGLTALIESKRGKSLVVYEAFPPIFKLKDAGNPTGLGRTRAQLVEEGKLNAHQLLHETTL